MYNLSIFWIVKLRYTLLSGAVLIYRSCSESRQYRATCICAVNEQNKDLQPVIELYIPKMAIMKFILLTPSQTSPGFTCLQYKPFKSTVRKGEIARNEQFLLFPQCFLQVLSYANSFSLEVSKICRLGKG